jgi:peroxiredoxin
MKNRTIAALGLFLSAGLTGPVSLAQQAAAPAQPAPAPAAPAQPAAPSRPATAKPIVNPADVRVEQKAKDLLQGCADALRKLDSISFQSMQKLEGHKQLEMGGEGRVRFIRNGAAPSASAVSVVGEVQLPMSPRVAYNAMFDGKMAQWLDTSAKVLNEQDGPVSDSFRQLKNCKDRLVPAQFFDLEPFGRELKADGLLYEGTKDIRGTTCEVVRAVMPASQRETIIFIGANDKLPRRIEMVSGHRDGKASYINELWDLSLSPVKPEDLHIKLPEGFEKRRLDPAPPPKPFNPFPNNNPNANQPAAAGTGTLKPADSKEIPAEVLDAAKKRFGEKAVTGRDQQIEQTRPAGPQTTPPPAAAQPNPANTQRFGLAPGADAPAWSLKPAGGGDAVALAGLKGKVVVLGFWGNIFGQSKTMLAELQKLHDGTQRDKLAVLGVACRTSEDNAKAYWTANTLSIPNLIEGDPVARDYKIRGYPSVTVIGPDGKVAAFFESTPTADALQAAIKKAQDAAGK